MACSGCGRKATVSRKMVEKIANKEVSNDQYIVKASENPEKKVKLRYYGGGMQLKSGTGCASCGSAGKYSLVTAENIMFASDDAPNGMFSQFFQVGRDYYVTEKQAEYLLSLVFTNKAGQTVNKFKKLED